LKKVIVFALVCFTAWNYYSKNDNNSVVAGGKTRNSPISLMQPSSNFTCDGRQHCSQMTSYEEALFFIRNCPNTKMDGDNDGVPCERQFNR